MIPFSMLFKYFMTDRSQNTCEHHSVIRLIGFTTKTGCSWNFKTQLPRVVSAYIYHLS